MLKSYLDLQLRFPESDVQMIFRVFYSSCESLRGNCTPNQKLSCFVLYLKIINTFWRKKKDICIL